jgi:hypothetical protein
MTSFSFKEESQTRKSKKQKILQRNDGQEDTDDETAIAERIVRLPQPLSSTAAPPATTITATTDDFLASMTFAASSLSASNHRRGCEDCDECGHLRRRMQQGFLDSNPAPAASFGAGGLPLAIARAVDRYREERLRGRASSEVKTTRLDQSRTLRMRSGLCSVWEWNLPFGASEPILEFGNSHRIVWVQRRPGMIQSIGTRGVVGSHDEESSRVDLVDWEAGRVIFVPSNGGLAVGYVHRKIDDEKTTSHGNGAVKTDHGGSEKNLLSSAPAIDGVGGRYATLLIAKIPDRLVVDYEVRDYESHPPMSRPSWLKPLLQVCQRLLVSGKDHEQPSSSASTSTCSNEANPLTYTVLDPDDAALIKSALSR